ncbi:dihydroxyacetone kinase family protein [Propionibacteriaceae bacterium Y2011]
MTRIANDPARFSEDMMRGFALAHPRHVVRVEGASGFRRADGPLEGKVTLLIGGGSGHYPSYNGVIGPGFADAAVLGDVFTSPAAQQVHRIAKAAHGNAGVVLAFGNYAGDRMNFGVAAERLRAEGIDTRVVWVTDDVASAPPDAVAQRRGIAGTFTVYKLAGAAAERGDDLDDVERIMRAANAATYTFGVAFDGCTMPGAREPLFTVADGSMDLGLGIHGEPGVRTTAVLPADRLAATLVDRVLAERPPQADGRAAVVLNGLGSTKYEELFVLFGEIAPLLHARGVEVVEPVVDEVVTSLDMAGCSLSVTWLDDELESLWTAPADTPAFRRGPVVRPTEHRTVRSDADRVDADTVAVADASPESRRGGHRVVAMLHTMQSTIEDHADELGRLDAVAGDGDHGRGMTRGVRGAVAAAEAAVAAGAGTGSVLRSAGFAWGDRAGGTSGILWGLLLSTTGGRLGDDRAPDAVGVADAITAGAQAVQELSGTSLGDKSLLDALFPFVTTLHREVTAGVDLGPAWATAATECTRAAAATATLTPRVGRARPLAERSVGSPDPGAISLALLVTALAPTLHDTVATGQENR